MGTGFGWGTDEAQPARGGRSGATQQTTQVGAVFSSGGSYQPSPTHGREQVLHSEYSPPLSSAQFAAESGLQGGSPYGDRDNTRGFGDTGHSCIRLHAPAGGGNAMGNGFGWGDEPAVPLSARSGRSQDAYASHMAAQNAGPGQMTSASMGFQVGSQVRYKQIGKAGIESMAVIVAIEPAASRKDNYRVQFQDGSERNTSQDRLTPT